MEELRHAEDRLSHKVEIRPQFKETWPAQRVRFFEPNSLQWWRKGVKPKRDGQRRKCYRAEDEFKHSLPQRKFGNIAEVAQYVRSLMETDWFQRRFPRFHTCRVNYVHGSTCCYGGPRVTNCGEVEIGMIQLSTWGMGVRSNGGGEVVVLHELAHAVLPSGHGHDRRWARTFLEFVGFKLGKEAERGLLAAFRKHKVKSTPPRKVVVPEHVKLKLAASRPTKRSEVAL